MEVHHMRNVEALHQAIGLLALVAKQQRDGVIPATVWTEGEVLGLEDAADTLAALALAPEIAELGVDARAPWPVELGRVA